MSSHLVFGAGLIGCYLGSVMSHRGFDVRLVCRPAIAEKLSDGVTLTDYQNNQCKTNVPCVDPSTTAGPVDVVWLTVKCTGVQQACDDMRGFIGPDTRIFCCQNGLGSDHIVKQAYPQNQILRVMVPFNVVEMRAGHYHRGSEGALCIEDDQQGYVGQLVAQLNCDALPVTSTQDMSALLWAKLQLNLGNSINALANIPVKAMLEQRGYRRAIAAMMRELLAVVEAQNVQLPKVAALPGKWLPFVLELPNGLFKLIANKMLAIDPNVRTSMWWDLSQGKPTEINHLNGAIVNAAQDLNIKTPVNQHVIRLVQAAEKEFNPQQAQRGISADQLLVEIDLIN